MNPAVAVYAACAAVVAAVALAAYIVRPTRGRYRQEDQ